MHSSMQVCGRPAPAIGTESFDPAQHDPNPGAAAVILPPIALIDARRLTALEQHRVLRRVRMHEDIRPASRKLRRWCVISIELRPRLIRCSRDLEPALRFLIAGFLDLRERRREFMRELQRMRAARIGHGVDHCGIILFKQQSELHDKTFGIGVVIAPVGAE